MTVQRRKYTEAFKGEAVWLMETGRKPITELARDLGINNNNLYRWRGVYGRQPQNTINGSVVELRDTLGQRPPQGSQGVNTSMITASYTKSRARRT